MTLLWLTACTRHDPDADPSGGVDTRDTNHTDDTYHLYWGDLHSHSNLSNDGCEDPDDDCTALSTTPAADVFGNAAGSGLDFAALTDHAEWGTWTDLDAGTSLDTWAETLRLARAAEGGPVLPVVGYEWTGRCPDDPYLGHRTVLFDDLDVCAALRVPACSSDLPKDERAREAYALSVVPAATNPQALALALDAALGDEACAGPRVLGFFHHPAYALPATTDWADERNRLDDAVVEIASEHGSSECADPEAEHCDFGVDTEFYDGIGAVQRALQLGYRFGFVGGTDAHDARPGSLADGAGPVAVFLDTDGDGEPDEVQRQFMPGALTGVWTTAAPLTRTALFDALEARHTVVTTWRPSGLVVAALGADGTRWLPGDTLPASAIPFTFEFDAPDLADLAVDVLDADGVEDAAASFSPAAGDLRYVRIRGSIDGVEVRAWASPFFAG